MSELKKGDLVMTEIGIVQYYETVEEGSEAYANGFTHIVVRLGRELTDINSWAVRELKELNRAEVEAYLKEKGWALEDGNYVQLGNMYIIPPPLNGYYGFALEFTAYEPYFENAPAMQAEAITMARLLNATKDN